MGVTNEFERNFNDTSFLHRPGRIDLIVFQNVADAGDGHPGLQRAFRNYLHEGGMEKDLDLNSYDIKNVTDMILTGEIQFTAATIHSSAGEIHVHPSTGNTDGNLIVHPIGTATSSYIYLRNSATANYGSFVIRVVGSTASIASGSGGSGTPPSTFNLNDGDWDNINIGDASAVISMCGDTGIVAGEWEQISNINSVTISNTQWGYLGVLDQNLRTSDTPSFTGLTLTANLVLGANSITGTSVDINNAEMQQISNIGTATISGTQWGYLGAMNQDVHSTTTPTFNGMTLNSTLVMTSQDINPVSNIYLQNDIMHDGDTNTSINFDTDQIRLYTGGGERLDVNNSGLEIGGTGQRVTHIENTISNNSDRLITSAGVYAHSSSVSNPHQVSAQQAFDKNATVTTTYVWFSGSTGTNGGLKIGEDIVYDYVQIYCANGSRSYIRGSGANGISFRRTSGSANDAYCVKVHYAAGDHHKGLEVENGNIGGTNTNPLVYFHDKRTGSSNENLRCQTDTASMGSNNHHIAFYDSSALVGRIHSEVTYAQFTGAHDSQTSEDLSKLELGMILSATGRAIGKPVMSRALSRVKLTILRKDKTVYGVYAGHTDKDHNFKGFTKNKEVVTVNALGEGMILVTDTNGDIVNGDYIQSSPLPGLGEKQDDDVIHNYTVAKATQSVYWNKIKAKNGVKKKLIMCTYHCG